MKDCAAFFVLNLRIRAGVEQQINDRPFALFDCQVEGCLAFKGFSCVNFLTSLDNKRSESEGMQRGDLGLTRLFNSSQLVRPAT